MYKILSITDNAWGLDGSLYFFNKRPGIGELRDDYWQNAYNICNGRIEICGSVKSGNVENYIVDKIDTEYGGTNAYRSFKKSGYISLDVIMDVDMIIFFPNWEVKLVRLYYKNNEVVEATSESKSCDRYISAFCYEVSKKKLYKTSGDLAIFKVM